MHAHKPWKGAVSETHKKKRAEAKRSGKMALNAQASRQPELQFEKLGRPSSVTPECALVLPLLFCKTRPRQRPQPNASELCSFGGEMGPDQSQAVLATFCPSLSTNRSTESAPQPYAPELLPTCLPATSFAELVLPPTVADVMHLHTYRAPRAWPHPCTTFSTHLPACDDFCCSLRTMPPMPIVPRLSLGPACKASGDGSDPGSAKVKVWVEAIRMWKWIETIDGNNGAITTDEAQQVQRSHKGWKQ
eukprot:228354-Pelagomonas_calceolata.AAC.1